MTGSLCSNFMSILRLVTAEKWPFDIEDDFRWCWKWHVKLAILKTRVTAHLENLEKSGNSKVVREKSGNTEKVRGSEIRRVFQALNTPKLVFRPGLCPVPHWGAYDAPPDLVGWGGGHLIPFPQLLQPQLLNNWLSGGSGLTLFFINIK